MSTGININDKLYDKVYSALTKGEILSNRSGVVVMVYKAPSTTRSGIILPESSSSNEDAIYGEVIAAGKGSYIDDGTFVPLEIDKHDVVLFSKWSGKKLCTVGDASFFAVQYNDILCIIKK